MAAWGKILSDVANTVISVKNSLRPILISSSQDYSERTKAYRDIVLKTIIKMNMICVSFQNYGAYSSLGLD